MTQVVFGSLVFTVLVLVLALIVLGARALLMPRGLARVTVNGDRVLDAGLGEKLLHALAHGGIHLPTSCGGAGTCGLCRVQVRDAREALPIERTTLHAADVAKGVRLACQLTVRGDIGITVAEQLLDARSWNCVVKRTHTVAPLIKEIVLALPEGEETAFPAGSYVEVTAPAFALAFTAIEIDPSHERSWERMNIRRLAAGCRAPVSRAYSLANRTVDSGVIVLNVRLALPPGSKPDAPPGVVSSYLFGAKPGDAVAVAGPFGDFYIKDTDREIVLIGGGVGMAPLRAHVFDQLDQRKTKRTISYWYGARSLIDLYYADEMQVLANEHPNFSWRVALSAPADEDDWNGDVGYIHDVVYRRYLASHPDPRGCEYYLCGPPLMIEAVRAMLGRIEVPPENILFDDFGG